MPDFAKNYEIGIKGDLLDRRFQYNADVFLINLENFQFNSYSPSGLPAVYNGSTARSKGVELELDAKVTQRLSTKLGYTYTDATVVDPTNIYDLPAFGGPGSTPVLAVAVPEGTRLPGVPKSVFNLGVDYKMPLAGTWSLDYHISGTYHTSSPGAIPGVYLSGYTIPSAKILDAKITLDSGKAWSIDLFGDNLTSDPNISGAVGVQGLPLNTLNFRNVSRPRTIGLTARYHFE
jgi:outer membrane receptor protein involved in Fe transport